MFKSHAEVSYLSSIKIHKFDCTHLIWLYSCNLIQHPFKEYIISMPSKANNCSCTGSVREKNHCVLTYYQPSIKKIYRDTLYNTQYNRITSLFRMTNTTLTIKQWPFCCHSATTHHFLNDLICYSEILHIQDPAG